MVELIDTIREIFTNSANQFILCFTLFAVVVALVLDYFASKNEKEDYYDEDWENDNSGS